MRFGSRKGERHVIARQLLPSDVPAAECADVGPEGGAPAHGRRRPGAEGSLRGADERRGAESRGSRACARAAPIMTGVPPVPLLCHHGGAPLWSAFLTGSITHRQRHRAEAAGGTADFAMRGPGTWAHRAPPRAAPDGTASGHTRGGRRCAVPSARSGEPERTVLFSARAAPRRTGWPSRRGPFGPDGAAALPRSGPAGGGPLGAVPGPLAPRSGPPGPSACPGPRTGAGPGAKTSHARTSIRKGLVPAASGLFSGYDLNPQFTPPARF